MVNVNKSAGGGNVSDSTCQTGKTAPSSEGVCVSEIAFNTSAALVEVIGVLECGVLVVDCNLARGALKLVSACQADLERHCDGQATPDLSDISAALSIALAVLHAAADKSDAQVFWAAVRLLEFAEETLDAEMLNSARREAAGV
ncbi:MAG: hypothetical protein WKG52_01010 [Variovorax sp.]